MITFTTTNDNHMLTKRKKYHFTNELIAKLFNYSSAASYKNSTAKPRIDKAIEQIITIVEEHIKSSL